MIAWCLPWPLCRTVIFITITPVLSIKHFTQVSHHIQSPAICVNWNHAFCHLYLSFKVLLAVKEPKHNNGLICYFSTSKNCWCSTVLWVDKEWLASREFLSGMLIWVIFWGWYNFQYPINHIPQVADKFICVWERTWTSHVNTHLQALTHKCTMALWSFDCKIPKNNRNRN